MNGKNCSLQATQVGQFPIDRTTCPLASGRGSPHLFRSESSGLNLGESAGLKRCGAPVFTAARYAALAGLYGPLRRDSLRPGDKGPEYRINGPRSRPQGRSFGRMLLRCSVLPSRFKNMWRRFEQRKIHRPKGVKQLRQARLKGQPRSSAAVVREAAGIYDFHDHRVKANQGSLTAIVPKRSVC